MVSLLFHDVFVRNPGESGFSSAAADRYKLPVDRFEAQLDGLAQARQPMPFVTTYDDGGVSFYTMVADRLDALGWRGHCFVTTDRIGRRGFLSVRQIRELDERGHIIGSHSVSHPERFRACRRDDMLREWRDSRDALQQIVGHAVLTASVPGGSISRSVARAASDAGLRVLFTSEPVTGIHYEQRCAVIGRFAIRHSSRTDLARRLVEGAPLARWQEWAIWNAKNVVRPLLGSSDARVADWLTAGPATGHHPVHRSGE
jgi:peptidoglycan/xylan/chitin deacetylase (PgdA/CDA1 family)